MATRPRRWAWTHRYAVPMFVTALVAFLLSATGLVAVLVLDDDGGGTDPQSGIDPCVLGNWRAVSHTERLSALGQDTQFTLAGEGPRFEFGGDGVGSVDFGDATTFEGSSFGQSVPATIEGTMTFRYEAADGTFQITEILTNETTFTIEVIPGVPVDTPYGLSTTTPEQYRCDEDSIELSVEERNYSAEYERLS
jgi:hypothetical protein